MIDGDTATTALDCFVADVVLALRYVTPITHWSPAHGSETTPLSVPGPRW
ncbi:hypothetical protein ACFTWF_15560 [Rhodococcus sp. NPDC056960]